MLSSVDFPQPLGPTTATNAPASSASEISLSTRYEPPRGPAKSRETPSSSNSIMNGTMGRRGGMGRIVPTAGPDRVVHEPQSGLRDGVGAGVLAMRTVAAVREKFDRTM